MAFRTQKKWLQGARNFVELLDVPSSYSGQAGNFLRVKSDETGLEYNSLSGYVPYTGATSDLDMNGWSITKLDSITADNGYIDYIDGKGGVFADNEGIIGGFTLASYLNDVTNKMAGYFEYQKNTTTNYVELATNNHAINAQGNVAITGTLGSGVATLSGNNANAAFTLLNLNNTDTPSTTETAQTSDLVFNLTQSVNSVISLHEAAKISAYKVSDWFHATTEADTDSGLKFWTTNGGTPTLQLTIDEVGLATFAGNLTTTGTGTFGSGTTFEIVLGNLSSTYAAYGRDDSGNAGYIGYSGYAFYGQKSTGGTGAGYFTDNTRSVTLADGTYAINAVGDITTTGIYYGDGSGLTGITGGWVGTATSDLDMNGYSIRKSSDGANANAIGASASATGEIGVAIGGSSQAQGYASVAIGATADAQDDYSTAIGYGATASETGATAIGYGVYGTMASYGVYIGSGSDIYLGLDSSYATFSHPIVATNGISDGSYTSIDPYNRILYGSDGTTQALSWSGGNVIVDSDFQLASGHYILDSGATGVLDPNNKRLINGWDLSYSAMSSASYGISFSGGSSVITDSTQTSIDPYSHKLHNVSGTEIMDYGYAQTKDTSGDISIDWDNRQLKETTTENVVFTWTSASAPQFNGLTTDGILRTGSTNGTISVETSFTNILTLCSITPVADGTYTVGAALTGGGNVGTITTVSGIITAVQSAT